jgi:serine/threonine protein kinase
MNYPDFSSLALTRVKLSDEVSAAWSRSTFLNYGSGAVIRSSDEADFPVIKIAHPDHEARQQLRHEFAFMKKVAGFPGMAKFDSMPLQDEDGIYGFRQERLSEIEFKDIGLYSNEVREVVRALHKLGYCHGDLSPSNVMRNENGQVVLIDFAFSGRIGDIVPQHVPIGVHEGGIFDKAADEDRLGTFFGQG